jgi:5-methylcytosine-specific restriction endonuclease McrA
MSSLQRLSHDQLLTQLHVLIQRDHTLEAELITHLGEVDARRLYLEQACPSMFHYCVHVLHFAEGVAYKRIAVARAARTFPELRVALESGDLHLTAASLLAPHLDRECAARWVAGARHKTAQEIREWIADRKPKEAVASSVRRVPTRRLASEADASKSSAQRTTAETMGALQLDAAGALAAQRSKSFELPADSLSPSERGRYEPLGAKRYCIRFEADEEFHKQLQELRGLLRHQVPDGDVAKILAQATGVLLEKVRKQKTGACASPRSPKSPPPRAPLNTPSKAPSRAIPAAIRRAVWKRDGGRCTYVSREGRHCESRDFLEFHHQVPWARSRRHTVSNIYLRCRSHNQWAAELDFGTQHMGLFRKREGVPLAERADTKSRLDLDPVGSTRNHTEF